jgi:hypothetical protein
MPRLKGADCIHTSRTIRGFRSCRHFSGISLTHFESGRIGFENEKIAVREALNRRHGRSNRSGSRPVSEGVPVHDRKTLIGD